ncbi:MAG: glycosyltransferase family 2 protein [Parvularculaceae bacterium]|nr:glycosyltransferase family 2 protein [Parvularculaceae bacterium]
MPEARPISVSIVFRSLNEEKWLGAALDACKRQILENGDVEIVLVDSGSTDRTVEIARSAGCRIVHIKKSDFTFGRSLNYGCDAARGDYLVFISAHCIPRHEHWLANLVAPLVKGEADYVYGKQVGHEVTRFSEHQIFAQYYPDFDKIPQEDFYCNNANAAIRREAWAERRFDETVTGLEDMVLAKAILKDGGRIGYVAGAPVLHIHEENLSQIRRRFYREALTLREIMPEVHFHFGDFVRFFSAGVFHDFAEALEQRSFFDHAGDIIAYRFMQYWGVYLGHNEHRVLSRAQKERYYYPRAKRGAETERADDTLNSAPLLAQGGDKRS